MSGRPPLELPAHLSAHRRRVLVDVADQLDDALGDDLLGLVLSGSAGRGRAVASSDLDLVIVLAGPTGLPPLRGAVAEVDAIPVLLAELSTPPPYGSYGWWFRWSYAWAPVLLDRTGGDIGRALAAQAALSPAEQASVLLDSSRLDGFLNYVHRSVKSGRRGSGHEARLDAAESVPWFLDVLFALHGRVRPYNSSLPWELTHHPLACCTASELVGLLVKILDGDLDALRSSLSLVEEHCSAVEDQGLRSQLLDVVHGWGEDLRLMRGT